VALGGAERKNNVFVKLPCSQNGYNIWKKKKLLHKIFDPGESGIMFLYNNAS